MQYGHSCPSPGHETLLMRPRSLILIILIVLLPTGLLTWFGLRMARDEKSITEQRFRSVMEQRLQDVNRLVERQFSETERRLQRITAIDGFSVPELRERVRSTPQVTQVFVLTPSGELLYPNPGNSLNGTEQSFLRQAARMLTERDLQNAVALAESTAGHGDFAPPPEFPQTSMPMCFAHLADSATTCVLRQAQASAWQSPATSPVFTMATCD